jgi:hypothetical protein
LESGVISKQQTEIAKRIATKRLSPSRRAVATTALFGSLGSGGVAAFLATGGSVNAVPTTDEPGSSIERSFRSTEDAKEQIDAVIDANLYNENRPPISPTDIRLLGMAEGFGTAASMSLESNGGTTDSSDAVRLDDWAANQIKIVLTDLAPVSEESAGSMSVGERLTRAEKDFDQAAAAATDGAQLNGKTNTTSARSKIESFGVTAALFAGVSVAVAEVGSHVRRRIGRRR